jgi:ABC-type sugar transport system ATPase subunit
MDEPVAMLDPVGKERVMSVVRSVTKGDTQATTIITESGADIEALAGNVDRVVALRQGEVVLDGPAGEALADPMLEEIGVGRPQVTDLFLKLRDTGRKLPYIPVDLDRAVEALRRLLAEAGVSQIELPAGYGGSPLMSTRCAVSILPFERGRSWASSARMDREKRRWRATW